jgi:5-formyltetrahydrofolate cyclo-ligase
MTSDLTKPALRRSFLKQRQSLSIADWQTKSQRLCQQLQTVALFQQAQTVLAYFSFRQEPDLKFLYTPLPSDRSLALSPSGPDSVETLTKTVDSASAPLEEAMLQKGRCDQSANPGADKVWGFPRCIDQSLSWHVWPTAWPLQSGAYGIIEPHPESPIVSPEQVDLILVPCVACDRQGYRLGYGGGFYDRLFANPTWQAKPAIGIAFEFSIVEKLPIDPWDLPLTAICSDTGCSST